MAETPQSSKKRPMGQKSSILYAAQCGECFKWRVISSKDKYEDMRSRFTDDPFHCLKKANGSCENPADIEYDDSRLWAFDKPNIPKTPEGFERELALRKDFSRIDTYYTSASGKKVKGPSSVASFLEANPEFGGLSVSDFNFTAPKLMEDAVCRGGDKKGSASGNKRGKASREGET